MMNFILWLKMEKVLLSTKYLCFGGAGTQVVAYVGAIDGLQKYYNKEYQLMLQNLEGAVGTSSGAVMALGLLVGIEHEKLLSTCQIILGTNVAPNFDFHKFMNNYGGDDGHVIKAIIETILSIIGLSTTTTFSDFYRLTKKDFVCTATKVVDGSLMLFRHSTTPELKLADAIFMSMSLPFLFIPKTYNGEIMLDGVLSCNVPYEVFPLEESLIFYQAEHKRKTDSLKNYIHALVSVSHSQQIRDLNKKRETEKMFNERSVFINVFNSHLTMKIENDFFWKCFNTGFRTIMYKKVPDITKSMNDILLSFIKIYVSHKEAKLLLCNEVGLE